MFPMNTDGTPQVQTRDSSLNVIQEKVKADRNRRKTYIVDRSIGNVGWTEPGKYNLKSMADDVVSNNSRGPMQYKSRRASFMDSGREHLQIQLMNKMFGN